jgi:sterol 3beta-glucosyltransferase
MSKPIVIFTIGTQGDVRPCVALGQGLHRAGYRVRIATSANFAELVQEAGEGESEGEENFAHRAIPFV